MAIDPRPDPEDLSHALTSQVPRIHDSCHITIAVSVAVCDMFNVKEWPDLETGLGFVQGHWKWHH